MRGGVSFVSAMSGRVLLIRWPTDPQQEDVDRFDALVAEARKAHGTPLFHVTFIREGTQLPAPPIQKALIRRAIKMQHVCGSMHAVLEGTGILPALGRRFLKGMVKMTGLKGAHVNADAQSAFAAFPPDDQLGTTRAQLWEAAVAAGVVSGPPPAR
jgi:hypothetical protein